jgi:hypothetical protein
MALELYQEVALTRDLPEYDLKAGDVAMLVDRVSHPNEGEEGYVLEIFNAVGESIKVIAVWLTDKSLFTKGERGEP